MANPCWLPPKHPVNPPPFRPGSKSEATAPSVPLRFSAKHPKTIGRIQSVYCVSTEARHNSRTLVASLAKIRPLDKFKVVGEDRPVHQDVDMIKWIYQQYWRENLEYLNFGGRKFNTDYLLIADSDFAIKKLWVGGHFAGYPTLRDALEDSWALNITKRKDVWLVDTEYSGPGGGTRYNSTFGPT